METPKYKLYAIRTADLAKDELKGFEYSFQANERYALVFTDKELAEPYRTIQDGIPLEKDEQVWLTECKQKITETKIKQNVAYMKKHESEYSEVLNEFAIALEKELKAEQEKLKSDNKKGSADNA